MESSGSVTEGSRAIVVAEISVLVVEDKGSLFPYAVRGWCSAAFGEQRFEMN